MSNRPGFFSLLAESQRRKDAVRRNSDRETPRRIPTVTAPNSERNGTNPHTSASDQSRASTPIVTPSNRSSDGIDLSAAALGSSDAWRLYDLEAELKFRRPVGLTDATEQASAACVRIAEANDYLDSAESVWDELCTARGQLQESLDSAISPNQQLRLKAIRTLGNIYVQLGDYDAAQITLRLLYPSLPLTRNALGRLQAWHEIDALLDYLRFLTTTARDLEQAEKVAKLLPWATPDVLRTMDRKSHALLSLIQALNGEGRHSEAFGALEIFELTSSSSSLLEPDYYLQKAVAAAGKGLRTEAESLFVDALVLSSLVAGAWHSQTLQTLYQFGKALRAWCKHESALKLLTLCCQGYYYRLGLSHPRSIQAYKELQACKGASTAMQKLRQLGHVQYSCKRKRSMAYEYSYLVTPVELLKPVIAMNYNRISGTLEQLLKAQGLSCRVRFDVRRNLAWCALEQNKLNVASTKLYELHHAVNEASSDTVGVEAYRGTLASDEAICSAKSAELGADFTRQRSKLVYLGLKDFSKERSHQVKAIIRRLTNYGLTHFTRDVVFGDPPLIIETNRERLGTGSSAIVDTVQIGEMFYARKSISLPRQNQHHLREDIRKEITITHALDHPHVVRVLLTYEETKHFSIIMHPLADCDLESYLANNRCDTMQERRLIWKWMACLVNTLAFIHSKDIRHKDIKPRNVLVKGEKVYFTDFGSGHMFEDSGNSTTDGLSYGHTKAYCAPEVIKNANRNRSSDVFSLGCVLAEMTAWSSEISMTDYFGGIRANRNGTDAVLYHESISHVKLWFEKEPRLTQRSKDMHSGVLRHMIRKNPDARCTIVEISRAIKKTVSSGECVKCNIDLWVPDSTAE